MSRAMGIQQYNCYRYFYYCLFYNEDIDLTTLGSLAIGLVIYLTCAKIILTTTPLACSCEGFVP